jgi:hypothetical protein
MIEHKNNKYTTTALTTDDDAISMNSKLNDTVRMIGIGKLFKDILITRFNNSNKQFNRWVKMNVDKDIKSVIRYMTLADNEDIVIGTGIIRLSEAYSMLGIDGNIDINYNNIE